MAPTQKGVDKGKGAGNKSKKGQKSYFLAGAPPEPQRHTPRPRPRPVEHQPYPGRVFKLDHDPPAVRAVLPRVTPEV